MANAARESADAGHMPDDLDIRAVLAGALAVAAAIIASMLAGIALMRVDGAAITPPPLTTPTVAGAPALQSAPARDIQTLREEQQRILTEYAWVDRDRGIVRIPIDRAMALLVAPSTGRANAPETATSREKSAGGKAPEPSKRAR